VACCVQFGDSICLFVCQFLGIVIIVFLVQVVIGIVAFICREQVLE